MLNRLNILHWICTAADKFSSAFSSKCFCSKEDKILIKNLRQLKGYTATRFLREFRTKNWTRTQILKRTVIQTYNSAKSNTFQYIVEPLRRYGHSKLSKMAAAAILNLFESKIAPLDPPSPKTQPYNKTWSGSDDQLRRYGHLKFFQHGGGRYPGFVRTGNRRPRKPYPRTKHEVDRITRCRDMTTHVSWAYGTPIFGGGERS